jgi:hypothetical protein
MPSSGAGHGTHSRAAVSIRSRERWTHSYQLTGRCDQCLVASGCRRLLLPRLNGPKTERPGPLSPAPRGAIKTDRLQYDHTTPEEVGVSGICAGAPMHSSADCNRGVCGGRRRCLYITRSNPARYTATFQGLDDGIRDSDVLGRVADEDVAGCVGGPHGRRQVSGRLAPSQFGCFSQHSVPPYDLAPCQQDAPTSIWPATCSLSAAFLRLLALNLAESGTSGTAAYWQTFQASCTSASGRLVPIGRPLPVVHRANLTGVGRLLTRSGSTSFPEAVIEIGQSGRSKRPAAPSLHY